MTKPKKQAAATEKNEKISRIEITGAIPSSEFSIEFLQRMLNHMGGRSIERYGLTEERYPEHDRAVLHIQERFTEYFYTRNSKFLIDAANFAMIEFMHPSIEDAFFEGTDSDQSPGRTFTGGYISSDRHTTSKTTLEKPSNPKVILETDTPNSEFSVRFIQGMMDRMTLSAVKYGLLEKAYPDKVNAAQSIRQRIEKYQATSNTEFLMDVANFCMIEAMRPSIAGVFYNPFSDLSEAGKIALLHIEVEK